MGKNEVLQFWLESANRDFETMKHLYSKKDYHWSLFMGHLVIEKLLKAYYTQNIDQNPPFTHNLLMLVKKCGLEPDETKQEILITVTAFNIRARYDDYKQEFYRLCTKEYTTIWLTKIEEIKKWIEMKLSV